MNYNNHNPPQYSGSCNPAYNENEKSPSREGACATSLGSGFAYNNQNQSPNYNNGSATSYNNPNPVNPYAYNHKRPFDNSHSQFSNLPREAPPSYAPHTQQPYSTSNAYPTGSSAGYPNSGPGYPVQPTASAVGTGTNSIYNDGLGGGVGAYNPHFGLSDQDRIKKANVLEFSKLSVRAGFVRKVYSIIMLQLLITSGVISLFVFHDGIKRWVYQDNIWFLVGTGAVALVLTIVSYFADQLRRRAPYNYILIVLVTIAYAVFVGAICAYFGVDAVLYGAGITVAVSAALALSSLQSRWKFTMWLGVIVSFVILTIITTILLILQHIDIIKLETLPLVFSCVGAFILSIILTFDMKRIIGGSHSCAISPEEYILGAIVIYTDIIIIFILIVLIVGASSSGGSDNCKNCSGGGGGHYHGGYYGAHWCICCCPVESYGGQTGTVHGTDEERRQAEEEQF